MGGVEILCIALVGAAMGFINNLAGAGGLLGLAVLDWAVGLDPVGANAALRPAAFAIGAAGLLGFARKGHRVPPSAWLYGLAATPGAVLGSILAIRLPVWVYQTTLAVVVITLVIQQLRRPVRGNGSAGHDESPPPVGALSSALWFTLVGLHMGFLQVAVGLLLVIALTHVYSRDYLQVTAAKTAVVICTALASTTSLGIARAIEWGPAGYLALGAGVGSFTASHWAVRKGHGAIRLVVLGVCALVLARLGWNLLAT